MELNPLPMTPEEVKADPATVASESSVNDNEPSTASTEAAPTTSEPADACTDPTPAADPVAVADTDTARPARQHLAVPETKAQALEMMLNLASKEDLSEINADEVAFIKQQFYQFRNNELATARDEYLAQGGEPDKFVVPEDPDEDQFREALAVVKDKKAAIRAAQEAEREANLARKQAIIDELLQMGADTDNVNRHYNRAKDLQAEFKEVGEVPAPKAAGIWKAYQEAVERFYDQWKVNKELRDYDFKKNLTEKQAIVDEARTLTDAPDPIAAFKRLQDLHDKWREIGPVAKDVREEIWIAFKDASAVINKRYQAFFEERKARERENETIKQSLCEQIEALDFSGLKSFGAWERMTATVLDLQEQWRKLGFVPRKSSNLLFTRFRGVCDAFFAAKAEYYRNTREEFNANIARKTELCERAEALKDSTDWRTTTEEMIELQKEWKTVGPAPKRQSDSLWHRFQKACDYFFEQKKANTSNARTTERANLKAKQEILAALQALNAPDSATPRAEAVTAVQELRAQWQTIGHVPFRDKDKLQEQYRVVLGELIDKLDINDRIRSDRRPMRNDRPRRQGADEATDRPGRERERLARQLEQRRSELATYENNLGFLSSKSKSGESLMREMERKMQQLRDDIAQLQEHIKSLDS